MKTIFKVALICAGAYLLAPQLARAEDESAKTTVQSPTSKPTVVVLGTGGTIAGSGGGDRISGVAAPHLRRRHTQAVVAPLRSTSASTDVTVRRGPTLVCTTSGEVRSVPCAREDA